MGRLETLPLLLSVWFASGVYLTKPIGDSIAATAPPFTPAKEAQRLSQDSAPDFSPPSMMPVPGRKLPHLHPSASLDLPSAPFPTFNSQQLDRQLQRYLRFVDQFGQPDILIIGSSRALQGIDPIVLQQTLAKRGYPNLKIFNFGINGATAQLVDWLLHQLLTPDQLPHMILWADGARAFNSGRLDTTYNRAIASKGHQLLTVGIHPTLRVTESSPSKQPIVLSLKLASHAVTKHPVSVNWVSSFKPALQRCQLYWEPLKRLMQPESIAKTESQTIATLQETTGFQSTTAQFKPEQYFQRYPKVLGAYDADYRNFTLDGKQTEALNNVVAFAKARQIPIVFINLPLTQIYLDQTRTEYEKQFRAYLQRFAQSKMLIVHDLSQRWLHQNDYFMDPSHLNQYGATAVTVQLSKRLVLPKFAPNAR